MWLLVFFIIIGPGTVSSQKLWRNSHWHTGSPLWLYCGRLWLLGIHLVSALLVKLLLYPAMYLILRNCFQCVSFIAIYVWGKWSNMIKLFCWYHRTCSEYNPKAYHYNRYSVILDMSVKEIATHNLGVWNQTWNFKKKLISCLMQCFIWLSLFQI